MPAPNGASPSLAFPRGRSKKNTPWVVFFFFALPPCRHGASPSPAFPRAGAKTNTLGGVFFFCCGPARALTHSLRAWVAMSFSRRGGVFFFCCGPARTGVVFFFFFAVALPGRSLTHCGLGRFRQDPGGVFFFSAAPPGLLDNNKKCLGYYIGSKKTRRGHSKKKTPLPKKNSAFHLLHIALLMSFSSKPFNSNCRSGPQSRFQSVGGPARHLMKHVDLLYC